MMRWTKFLVVVVLLLVVAPPGSDGADVQGACCLDEGCVLLSEGDCTFQEGVYQGDFTSCEEGTCQGVPATPQSGLVLLAVALLGTGAAFLTRRRFAGS